MVEFEKRRIKNVRFETIKFGLVSLQVFEIYKCGVRAFKSTRDIGYS